MAAVVTTRNIQSPVVRITLVATGCLQSTKPNMTDEPTQPSDEIESNHVTMQMQPGYLLGDKVIRPAQVGVAQ